jgi:hypothetical protein
MDLIVFDSSLMQMAEVAYEIRNSGRYIVGSEESPPGEGYPYDAVIPRLQANPNMDAPELGRIFADEALAEYGQNSDITQSVLDTSRLEAIPPAMDALGRALSNVRGTYGTQISNARSRSEEYAYPYYRDILDFCRYLSDGGNSTTYVPDGNVQSAVGNVRNAVSGAIIHNVHGRQHPNSNGLSVFLASPSEYITVDNRQAEGFGQRYGLLEFTQTAPGWQEFLINGPR